MDNTEKIKRELVRYGRMAHEAGLVIGTGGNISARIGDRIYLKASSVSLAEAVPSDYIAIDIKKGRQLETHKACSIELPMHLACYLSRRDIGAVIHTHPVCGTAAGLVIRKLGIISYEHATSIQTEVPVVGYLHCGSVQLGRAVGKAIKRHNAVLLKNHGTLTAGKDLKEAFLRAVALERACNTYLMAQSAGNVGTIPLSEVRRILA